MNDTEELGKTWNAHWKSLEIDEAHRDVLSSSPSSNTSFYRPVIDRLLAEYASPAVLEAGCGLGQWLYYVATRSSGTATGLDVAADTLERVAAAPALRPFIDDGRVKLVRGDMRRTPFADRSFDLVFSFGVIEHVRDEESQKAVHEFARILDSGGRVFITTPNLICLHTLTRPIAKAVGRWTVGFERSLLPSKLRRYAKNAGLEIERSGVLDTGQIFGAALSGLIPPLRSISHWIERRQRVAGFISYCIAIKR